MRAFKTHYFQRWARSARLTDAALRKAVEEMAAGLIDADLGGGIIKKRVALPGRGKSGGARTIVATNRSGHWFFLFGYEKNVLDNIGDKALRALQDAGADLLALDDNDLAQAMNAGELLEIA
ncbi:MAG: type II toxin-antitoxin system RelE/ParE family toxin [Burkholderiaceae bacterium]|jgi:hypothetical protein|nr:type II toxin-antitoxin system RelE/ParE family toxin [Burkholderiaceae bacterium]